MARLDSSAQTSSLMLDSMLWPFRQASTLAQSADSGFVSVEQKYSSRDSFSAATGSGARMLIPSMRQTSVMRSFLLWIRLALWAMQSLKQVVMMAIKLKNSSFSARSIRSFCSLGLTCVVLLRLSVISSSMYSSSRLMMLTTSFPSSDPLKMPISSLLNYCGCLSYYNTHLVIFFSVRKHPRMTLLYEWFFSTGKFPLSFSTKSLLASLSKKQTASLRLRIHCSTLAMIFLFSSFFLIQTWFFILSTYSFSSSGCTGKGTTKTLVTSTSLRFRGSKTISLVLSAYAALQGAKISSLSIQSQIYWHMTLFLGFLATILTIKSKSPCMGAENWLTTPGIIKSALLTKDKYSLQSFHFLLLTQGCCLVISSNIIMPSAYTSVFSSGEQLGSVNFYGGMYCIVPSLINDGTYFSFKTENPKSAILMTPSLISTLANFKS